MAAHIFTPDGDGGLHVKRVPDRLSAAREGVVKALEGLTSQTAKYFSDSDPLVAWPDVLAETHRTARAALKELEEASK